MVGADLLSRGDVELHDGAVLARGDPEAGIALDGGVQAVAFGDRRLERQLRLAQVLLGREQVLLGGGAHAYQLAGPIGDAGLRRHLAAGGFELAVEVGERAAPHGDELVARLHLIAEAHAHLVDPAGQRAGHRGAALLVERHASGGGAGCDRRLGLGDGELQVGPLRGAVGERHRVGGLGGLRRDGHLARIVAQPPPRHEPCQREQRGDHDCRAAPGTLVWRGSGSGTGETLCTGIMV